MRIDRVVDWDYSDLYRVRDWIDLSGVGIEIEFDCKYKGDGNDWPRDDYDLSKLYLIPGRTIDLNLFQSYAGFKHDREDWLREPEHATTIYDIKKSDPIFKRGIFENTREIINYIFKIGPLK